MGCEKEHCGRKKIPGDLTLFCTISKGREKPLMTEQINRRIFRVKKTSKMSGKIEKLRMCALLTSTRESQGIEGMMRKKTTPLAAIPPHRDKREC